MKLIEYIKNSPTAFHAVSQVEKLLKNQKFIRLYEDEKWNLSNGGKYYVIKNDSALIAFVNGGEGFNIVAAHTDSPAFKLKAKPEMKTGDFVRLNVESYGGGIFNTWYDRKLTIAGRLVVEKNGVISSKQVTWDKFIVIPNLAVHMNRNVNEGVKVNPQVDMCPLFGSGDVTVAAAFAKYLESGERVLDYDLFVVAAEDGYLFGANDEFVSSPRLDDLEGVFGGTDALLGCNAVSRTAVLALFDNEEVGSGTKQGAGSTFLADVLKRICLSRGSEEDYMIALSKSMMVSMDNAHSKHPNHPELNDPTNNVVAGGGIVIKHHANQHYTTDGESSAIVKFIFERAGVACQDFYMRSDMRCGGTLGAISSSQLSIKSVDIGMAQWAMHSAVESASVKDYDDLVLGLKAFFQSDITFGKTVKIN